MKRTINREKLAVMEQAQKKHPGGRPTKYDPIIMIPMVKACMSLGMSRQEVCLYLYREGAITPSTFWSWEKKHPEFLNAIKEGEYLEEGWWKEQGRKNINNNFFNVGLYVVQMANRFSWKRRDSVEQTITGSVEHKHEHQHTYDFSKLQTNEVESLRDYIGRSRVMKKETLSLLEENRN